MIDLYYAIGSPPCRLVLMVVTAMNMNINHHLIDLKTDEQLKPEFLLLNPQHTVPTIVDDGFSLWESRAIARYICNKYKRKNLNLYPDDDQKRAVVDMRMDFDLGNLCPSFTQYFLNPQHTVPTIVDDGFSVWESRAIARYLANRYNKGFESLYPRDPQKRAVIDQRLDFDLGCLTNSFTQYFYPQLFSGEEPSAKHKKKLDDALNVLESFLEGEEFAAGQELTIADLALVTTVSTIEAGDVKLDMYPNIMRWFLRMKEIIPGYKQFNEQGLQEFKKLVDDVKQVRRELKPGKSRKS